MRYATNAIIPVQSLFVDITNTPITNGDARVTIRRVSDDRYFDGVSAFAPAVTLIAMAKVDGTDLISPGWWEFNFNTNGFAEDTYIFTVTDANGFAQNTPQTKSEVVSDALARAIEAAAAGGVGRAVYNAAASTLTLYKWDDPATILIVFNAKNPQGDPAGSGEIFEKIPV